LVDSSSLAVHLLDLLVFEEESPGTLCSLCPRAREKGEREDATESEAVEVEQERKRRRELLARQIILETDLSCMRDLPSPFLSMNCCDRVPKV